MNYARPDRGTSSISEGRSIIEAPGRLFLDVRSLTPLLAICLLLFADPSIAQSDAVSPTTPVSLQLGELEARIADIESRTELDQSVREAAIDHYRAAITYVEAAQRYQGNSRSFEEAIKSTPLELASIRKTLERTFEEEGAGLEESVPEESTLAELETALLETQASQTSLSNETQGVESQLRAERDRPNAIRQRLSALDALRIELEEMLAETSAADNVDVIQEAERLRRQAQYGATLTEREMLEQELLGHDARTQLLSARLDRARRDLALAQARRKLIESRVEEARRAAAERTQVEATETRIKSAGKHPLIVEVAEYNAELSDELTKSGVERSELNEQLARVTQLSEQIEHDFRTMQQRIEIAGLSEALGRALTEVRRGLPDFDRYQREVVKRQPVLREIGLAQLRVSDRRHDLSRFEHQFWQVMGGTGDSLSQSQTADLYAYLRELDPDMDLTGLRESLNALSPEERENLRETLVELYTDQQSLLNKLDATYSENLRALGDLDFAQRQVVERAQVFVEFIDEHLLWTPTTSPIGFDTLKALPKALRYLVASENWSGVVRALIAQIRLEPARALIAAFIVVVLIAASQRLKRKLVELGIVNRYPYPRGYVVTLQALLVSALIVVIWPLILAFIGRRLQIAAEVPEFVNALGHGLIQTAWFLLLWFGFRVLCAKGGVAVEQFKWSPSVVALLRRHLRWFLPLAVPAVLITTTLARQSEQSYIDDLARLTYLVLVIAMGVFIERVFNPRSGLIAERLARGDTGWLVRLRYLWYALVVGVPAASAVLAFLGYFYSTAVLMQAVYYTIWLFVAARILSDLVARWVIVTQRRLEWKELQETREERQVRGEESDAGSVGEGGLATPHEDTGLDFQTINEQTRRLLNAALVVLVAVGLVGIWASIVPAFTILEDVVLWQYRTDVDSAVTTLPITLVDLSLAIAIVIVTIIAARNLPGLLEDRPPAAPAAGRRASLCDQQSLPVHHRGSRGRGRIQHGRCRLGSRSVVGSGPDGGARIWSPRNLRQFHIGSHHSF